MIRGKRGLADAHVALVVLCLVIFTSTSTSTSIPCGSPLASTKSKQVSVSRVGDDNDDDLPGSCEVVGDGDNELSLGRQLKLSRRLNADINFFRRRRRSVVFVEGAETATIHEVATFQELLNAVESIPEEGEVEYEQQQQENEFTHVIKITSAGFEFPHRVVVPERKKLKIVGISVQGNSQDDGSPDDEDGEDDVSRFEDFPLLDGYNSSQLFELMPHAQVKFQDLQFVNGSGFNGGAVLVDFDAVGEFDNCLFRLNFARNLGGALYVSDGKLVVENCWFTHNRAVNGGGAVAVVGGTFLGDKNHFVHNRAIVGGQLYLSEKGFAEIGGDNRFIFNHTLVPKDGEGIFVDLSFHGDTQLSLSGGDNLFNGERVRMDGDDDEMGIAFKGGELSWGTPAPTTPTVAPTTAFPTVSPSISPTHSPIPPTTAAPTQAVTSSPSLSPSSSPSSSPTFSPVTTNSPTPTPTSPQGTAPTADGTEEDGDSDGDDSNDEDGEYEGLGDDIAGESKDGNGSNTAIQPVGIVFLGIFFLLGLLLCFYACGARKVEKERDARSGYYSRNQYPNRPKSSWLQQAFDAAPKGYRRSNRNTNMHTKMSSNANMFPGEEDNQGFIVSGIIGGEIGAAGDSDRKIEKKPINNFKGQYSLPDQQQQQQQQQQFQTINLDPNLDSDSNTDPSSNNDQKSYDGSLPQQAFAIDEAHYHQSSSSSSPAPKGSAQPEASIEKEKSSRGLTAFKSAGNYCSGKLEQVRSGKLGQKMSGNMNRLNFDPKQVSGKLSTASSAVKHKAAQGLASFRNMSASAKANVNTDTDVDGNGDEHEAIAAEQEQEQDAHQKRPEDQAEFSSNIDNQWYRTNTARSQSRAYSRSHSGSNSSESQESQVSVSRHGFDDYALSSVPTPPSDTPSHLPSFPSESKQATSTETTTAMPSSPSTAASATPTRPSPKRPAPRITSTIPVPPGTRAPPPPLPHNATRGSNDGAAAHDQHQSAQASPPRFISPTEGWGEGEEGEEEEFYDDDTESVMDDNDDVL